MACTAAAGASLLACSRPTKSVASFSSSSPFSYATPSLSTSSHSSSVYYSSLGSGGSAFFKRGDGEALWGMRTVRVVSPVPSSSSGALGCRCIFGLGVPELVVIAGVAALVFGPKKLPEIGRSIGKTVKSFQQAAKEFETELKKEPDESTESPAEKSEVVGGADEKKELEASGTKEST